jgi:tape measure domain-containing protein
VAERITIEIRGVDRASGAIRRVGGALGSVATIAAGLIAFRVFERIASGIISIGRAAAEAYEWFNRIQFSLEEMSRAEIIESMGEQATTAEGYAKALSMASLQAQELLDWVIQLAIQSPFTAEDVNQMFRLLRAYGFTTDRAKELTGTILDFSSATGFGSQVLERMGLALGQVQQRGKLAGEEIRQLINVGIPVRDIVAKAMEVTTGELEKMIRKGLVPASEALPAIVEWMTRFNGASERAVTTWFGLVANMKDVKDLNLIKLFEGIAKVVQPGLQSLFDFLTDEETMDMFGEMGDAIGRWLVPIIQGIPTAVESLSTMKTMLQGLKEGWITPGGAITGLLNMLGLIEQSDVRGVNEKLNSVITIIGSLTTGLADLADAWIGPIKDALPGWLDSLSQISTDVFAAFVPMWQDFVTGMKELADSVAPQVMLDITEGLQGITEWWEGGAAESAANILDFLLTLGGGGVVGALAILAAAFGVVGDVLSGKDPLPRMAALLETFQILAADLADTTIFDQFATALSQGVLAPQLTDEAMLAAAASGEAVGDSLSSGVVAGLQAAEQRVAGEVVSSLNDQLTNPATFWANLTGEQQMRLVGEQVAEALGDGFLNKMASEKKEIEAMLNSIISMVDELYDIQSPSKVFDEKGKQIAAGLGGGIIGGAGQIMENLKGLGRQVNVAMKNVINPPAFSPVMTNAPIESIVNSASPSKIDVKVDIPESKEKPPVVFENVNIDDKLTATAFGLVFEEYTGVR